MSGPQYGFAADPRAVEDLLHAPAEMRDQALMRMQEVVNGTLRGRELTANLAGLRKIYIDPAAAWRLVYEERPAPPGSAFAREIYLVAVRPKARNNIYLTVAARLGRHPGPVSARVHAARAASPQAARTRPLPAASPSSEGFAR
ncbi:cytochrome P460 family protein [Streptomyces sp. YIM 98790]|uniref:cytochrome P460 family protein n=1 Tax=Streptomyces sp. YIM 98790 TaxID=2689077 RepID=UPI00140C4D5A|nr:cytochrome P460 family protein [Streptomyces sp. YIM 98790]